MHLPPHRWLLLAVGLICAALLWLRLTSPRLPKAPASKPINDLSVTSPLNQPGGGTAPGDAYEIYSALYQEPMPEPLVFAADSMTDIPQVNGSCLKPSSQQEREMTDAFVAANQRSHRWERKFAIPQGYRLLTQSQTQEAQSCLETHSKDTTRCGDYRLIQHLRFLGIVGFDRTHMHALASVVKMCGRVCGSGGIFEVENTGGTWSRSPTTDFTRECSWMY